MPHSNVAFSATLEWGFWDRDWPRPTDLEIERATRPTHRWNTRRWGLSAATLLLLFLASHGIFKHLLQERTPDLMYYNYKSLSEQWRPIHGLSCFRAFSAS